MKITASIEGIQRVQQTFARIASAPMRALDATAVRAEQYIDTQLVPHNKTHALERSLGKRRIPGGWEIGHDSRIAPYARFVHDGTKPHMIFPRNKKALRWPVGSKFRFSRKGVKHPGYKGDPWLRRAAAEAPAIFRRHLEALLAKES